MQRIGNFDLKISVIPNGFKKYIAFTINKNLVFIDSMQFMNSSLDALAKSFSDKDFEHLSQEFIGEFLKLVKQKKYIHMNISTVFKKVLMISCLIDANFLLL